MTRISAIELKVSLQSKPWFTVDNYGIDFKQSRFLRLTSCIVKRIKLLLLMRRYKSEKYSNDFQFHPFILFTCVYKREISNVPNLPFVASLFY